MHQNQEKFVIQGLAGERKLKGTIRVNGAKNAVLPLLASTILFKDIVRFSNVPQNEDVKRVIEMLKKAGMSVSVAGDVLTIDTTSVSDPKIDPELSKKMRSSVFLTGPLLARFGEVSFPKPGGCVLGARPINFFIDGYEQMGATVDAEGEDYVVKGTLTGAEIFFVRQSVGATETLMMAAILATGKTILKNCAMEPEITSLAEFLNQSGAKITGAGTPTISIEGNGPNGLLSADGKIFRVIPDRIEAGCFLVLGALCASELTITDCNPEDLEAQITLMRQSGISISTTTNSITVHNPENRPPLKPLSVITHEFPGFATDVQPPMLVFLTQVEGESLLFETIYEGRLHPYVPALVKTGANIIVCDPHRAIIKGPTRFEAGQLDAPDIRAGFAYIVSALLAKGQSEIHNAYYIDRGHERIEERLNAIGANIKRERLETRD